MGSRSHSPWGHWAAGRPLLESSRGPLAQGRGLSWAGALAGPGAFAHGLCLAHTSTRMVAGQASWAGVLRAGAGGGCMAEGTCPRETRSHSAGHGEESRPHLSRGWRGPRRHGGGGWQPLGGWGRPPRPPGPAGTSQLCGHQAPGPRRGLLKGLQGPGLFAAPRPGATCQLDTGSQGVSRRLMCTKPGGRFRAGEGPGGSSPTGPSPVPLHAQPRTRVPGWGPLDVSCPSPLPGSPSRTWEG